MGGGTISEEPAGERTERYEIPLVWAGVESAPLNVANHLAIQVDLTEGEPDGVLLTIGFASPPVLIGSAERQTEQLEQIREVEIKALARFSLTRRRLEQWVELFTATLKKMDNWEGKEDR